MGHTDETEPRDTQLEYAEQEQDVTLQININEEKEEQGSLEVDTVEEDKDERRRKKDENLLLDKEVASELLALEETSAEISAIIPADNPEKSMDYDVRLLIVDE